jgi:hydroxymethylpyrimidine kinase/phosphomethylpyrimidine kinase
MPKVVLTIGGSDSGGGAGIQADIKTFSALGLHGTCAITAVTAQNTLGLQKAIGLSPYDVSLQLRSITDDFRVAFAKTGMLYSPEIVSAVSEHLRKEAIPFVLDPVIEAEAGGRLLRPEAVRAVKDKLIPLADVVTPNIFEAAALTGIRVTDIASSKEAALKISEMGAKAVIIKGGHLDVDCTDLLLKGGEVHLQKGQRVKCGNHGVGCTYSAALTSFLALGNSLEEAALKAKDFAAKSISHSMDVGRGVAPVNQSGYLRENAERFLTLDDIQRALDILLAEPEVAGLMPDTGLSIGMAIHGATSVADVAVVDGQPETAGYKILQPKCAKFNASGRAAEIILAAMKFDPGCRAAMSLNASALENCRAMGLEISGDVLQAVKMYGRVSGAICDKGQRGREPVIWLLGSSAIEVAVRAVNLAKLV